MDITSLMNTAGTAHTAAAHTVASSLAKAAATTTASTATGTSITSTDFLSLLVTEMKNQDPTQPTDPNAYIQQLVGVNSLQQLIQINQELGTVTTPSGSGSGSAAGAIAAPVGEI